MTQLPTADLAINAALSQNWQEAIRINTALLKADKSNIDALNRLGYALLRSGDGALAKKTYEKVLKIDAYNQIALKNLKKASSAKSGVLKHASTVQVSPLIFLEDPGKTKIIVCVHTAPEKVLASLSSGQEVFLRPKKHCVEIRDEQDTYLGALPDDVSFKLNRFLLGGNTYQVVIKNIAKNTLTVFIRETARGKKFTNQPSFITSVNTPFARSEGTLTPNEKPDVTPTGEDDDAGDSIVESDEATE